MVVQVVLSSSSSSSSSSVNGWNVSVYVDCLVIMADGQMAALVMAHGPGLGQDAKSGKLVPSLEVLRITSQKCYESPDKNSGFFIRT